MKWTNNIYFHFKWMLKIIYEVIMNISAYKLHNSAVNLNNSVYKFFYPFFDKDSQLLSPKKAQKGKPTLMSHSHNYSNHLTDPDDYEHVPHQGSPS